MNHHVAVMRESHVKELLDIQSKVESVQSDINTFHSIIDQNKNSISSSLFLHKQSSAILALESILKTSKPFSKHINELKNIVTEEDKEDELILSVINSIPINLQTKGKSDSFYKKNDKKFKKSKINFNFNFYFLNISLINFSIFFRFFCSLNEIFFIYFYLFFLFVNISPFFLFLYLKHPLLLSSFFYQLFCGKFFHNFFFL